MYYPILRGRQNELLAIKELLNKSVLSEKIIPIIEPVKLTPTLVNTLGAFAEANREVALIRNPQVGSFKTDAKNPKNAQYKEKLSDILLNQEIKRGHIINKNTPSRIDNWRNNGVSDSDIITLCTNPDFIKFYVETFQSSEGVKTLVPYSSAFRKIRKGRILLEDKFNKKSRNQDYLDDPDEFFSDDHLYYQDDGYVGFSDYSIIGSEYTESGFAPHAVAIHIVYFNEAHELRIRHFVSEDNEDITDPAKKFYQAVTQLVEWNKTQRLDTIGIKTFEKIYEEQSYPGLGVVKKLSLMHHLELIGLYLDGEL
ncbi:MAG: sce7725 family protein [Clostridia bacterium]|nr:sce7725 family protein [Clostridia bacterium]